MFVFILCNVFNVYILTRSYSYTAFRNVNVKTAVI